MPLIPLDIPPGLVKNGTDLQARGRWANGNLIRFHEDAVRPIGGWRIFKETGITRTVRGMIGWSTNGDGRWVAAGSSNSLHAISPNGTVTDITPAGFTNGLEQASINTGYGGGFYGVGAYGTPRDDATTFTEAGVWTLDTWGENLIGCMKADGKLYEWDLNTANNAVQITNSPTSCLGLVSTEERFIFALGATGNRRLVAWCDQEDNTTWTATATNQAGDFEIQSSGQIMQGVRTRGQTLILTDVDAYTATFVGGNAVYSFERIGNACGGVSRLACASAEGTAYWMGRRSFFRYGGGSVEPLESEVADEVFTNINRDQVSQIWSVTNSLFGEVWWFYPSGSSTVVDSYVALNYRFGHWTAGALDRSAGFDFGSWRHPMWIASDGTLYEHENAFSHGSETPFVESGPITLGTGERVMVCKYLYPDEETQGDVQGVFKARFYPNGTEREYGPFDMTNPTSIRFTGRQVRMRLESTGPRDWRVGTMRIDADPGGER